jgi:hypothetical protein
VQDDGKLELILKELIPHNKPIYMFAGCRYIPNQSSVINLKDIEFSFESRNLKDLIFAHEVTYPQYPKSLNIGNLQPNEPTVLAEIHRLQEFKGFSLEDPSDICLAHIFTDSTSDQFVSANEQPLYLPNTN